MPKTESPRKFDSLSAADVAELLGVTEKSVRNWMNKNGLQFVDGQRGRSLKWPDVLEWYVRYRAETRTEAPEKTRVKSGPDSGPELPPENYEAALARKTRAEADLKELDLAERRGQVAGISDVRKTLSTLARAIQSKILAMPARLTTRLAGAEDRSEVEAILKAECQIVCSELASMKAAGE